MGAYSVKHIITILVFMVGIVVTSGCAKKYVVVSGEEKVTVRKSTLDTLFSDNEALARELDECRRKDLPLLDRLFK